MESTKTQKMVLAAMLAALGMILNLIEIPYPFAPWLNLDLSEIVVLVAISTLGFVPALFVCICKFFVSILFKGPVGPMAIGQIAALIASLSICVTYSLLARKIDPEKNLKNYFLDMVLTMLVFAFIMFVINYHQIAALEQRTRELKAFSIEILHLAKQAKEWLRI